MVSRQYALRNSRDYLELKSNNDLDESIPLTLHLSEQDYDAISSYARGSRIKLNIITRSLILRAIKSVEIDAEVRSETLANVTIIGMPDLYDSVLGIAKTRRTTFDEIYAMSILSMFMRVGLNLNLRYMDPNKVKSLFIPAIELDRNNFIMKLTSNVTTIYPASGVLKSIRTSIPKGVYDLLCKIAIKANCKVSRVCTDIVSKSSRSLHLVAPEALSIRVNLGHSVAFRIHEFSINNNISFSDAVAVIVAMGHQSIVTESEDIKTIDYLYIENLRQYCSKYDNIGFRAVKAMIKNDRKTSHDLKDLIFKLATGKMGD